jgi:hypothetical protein
MSSLMKDFQAYKKRLLAYQQRFPTAEVLEVDMQTHKFWYYPDGPNTFGCMLNKRGVFEMYIPRVALN